VKDNLKTFALKALRKDKLKSEADMIEVKNERDILSKIATKRMIKRNKEH
jgi:hypothetical protein